MGDPDPEKTLTMSDTGTASCVSVPILVCEYINTWSHSLSLLAGALQGVERSSQSTATAKLTRSTSEHG